MSWCSSFDVSAERRFAVVVSSSAPIVARRVPKPAPSGGFGRKLPDAPVDPWGAVNPYQLWLMVIAISAFGTCDVDSPQIWRTDSMLSPRPCM